MNSQVYIKSYKNGLKVYLDSECSFVDLCNELKEKIAASKNFFKGGKIAIDFEGRVLSDDEELLLVRIMEAAGEMTVLYVVGKDEETNQSFLKAIDKPIKEFERTETVGKIFTGNIKKNDIITTESSIVVLGDVEPGGKLISKGNIIILGGLYGCAEITDVMDRKYFICANDINAERITIGDYSYISKEKPKWVVKPKMTPKIAYIEGMSVEIMPISGAVLRKLCDVINK